MMLVYKDLRKGYDRSSIGFNYENDDVVQSVAE